MLNVYILNNRITHSYFRNITITHILKSFLRNLLDSIQPHSKEIGIFNIWLVLSYGLVKREIGNRIFNVVVTFL